MAELGVLLRRLREAESEVAKTAYFAEYSISDDVAIPRTDDLRVPDSLVAWHVVSAANIETRVITYWSSKEAFLRDQKAWRDQIKGKLLSNSGWIGRIESYQPPWWRRIKLLHIVLMIAGIFTALETIKNHSDRIFAAPAIALQYETKQADFIEGAPIELKATVVNQIRTTHSDVQVKATLRQQPTVPGQTQKAQEVMMIVSEANIPELIGGEKRELTMSGKAPSPGEYAAEIDVAASAGWLRAARKVQGVKSVKVWALRPFGRVQATALSDARGKLNGEIEIGPESKYGLDCELQITGLTNLRLMSFNTNAPQINREWYTASTPGQEIHLLTWSVPEVKAMQSIRFELVLEHDSATKWDSIARATKPECVYRQL